MSKAYTPSERAYRAATLAWLGVVAAFVFLLLSFAYTGSSFLDFCLIASAISALLAVVLGGRSLFLASSPRAWWATGMASLLLAFYALVLYMLRDFCVIC